MELATESTQAVERLDAQTAELYQQGRYDEAIPLALHVLEITEKERGPLHSDTAASLNNLAALYQAAGHFTEAAPLFERALAINEKMPSGDSQSTALALNNLASLYQAMGDYAKGEPLYRRAIAIMEKARVLDKQSAGTYAAILNNLAELYKVTAAYAKARPLYERALAIDEEWLGPIDPTTALALNNMAEFHRITGEYARAEPLYRRALAINDKVCGALHPNTARFINNLAGLYFSIGAYAKAEPLFQRALAIREKVLGPEHPDVAIALNNVATLYQTTAEYGKAEPLFQRALRIREKVLGPEHPLTAASLDSLGELYCATGSYAKAEPLYQRALAICEQAPGAENPDTARVLNNLAGLYQDTGAYAKAEPLYQRALAICLNTSGPEHPDTAAALNNLAGLYYRTGAYAKAQPLYLRALEITEAKFGPDSVSCANQLNNLGEYYRAAGAYTKAEPLFQRALAIREKALGPENPLTAISLNNLAGLYCATGAYERARPLRERALAISEKVLGPEHPDTANALNNLACLHCATGAYAQAEPLFQRALDVREKILGPEHPDTALSLGNLARLYHATGEYLRAEPLYERAQGIEENNTARFLLSGSEVRKQAYLQGREDSVCVNVSFSLANASVRSITMALTSVLQYKGRVLDVMSDSEARLRRSVVPGDQSLFDQLSTVAQQFSALMFRGPERLSSEVYRRRLDTLAQEQEQLQTELSSRSAALRQAVTPITLEGVRQALPVEAVLLEWFRYRPFDPKAESVHWGAPRYVAYVLKHAGEPVAVDLGAAQPIEDLLAEFRTSLSDPASTYFKEVAGKLSGMLIKPLRPHFAQSERLLLCLDGALNLVPFAALVDEHGEYLVRHFELTYLTSGRDLLRMAAGSPPRGSAVVLANPNYGQPPTGGPPVDAGLEQKRSADLDRSGLIFKALPGTAEEATSLQSLLQIDAQNVLTGDRATEVRLRGLHGPRILHMATHGFFLNDLQMKAALRRAGFTPEAAPLPLGENPLLRSGLALAGANARHSGATDDGILTAAEAAELDLLGTQLVVLSACETGVGTVQTGEGVYGLRRALVLAGAQTQLVSLWKVNDAAARELMVDYYQRLLKGEGRSGALRTAQQAMMVDPARQHPCYWAAFIQIGDWTPLPNW